MAPSHSSPLKKFKSGFLFFPLLFFSVLIYGCGLNKNEELYSKDVAERKFIQICREEYNWDVKTKLIDNNTLWIYIPYQGDIFQLKANRFAQTSRCAVSSLKGEFSNGIFYFEYQITPLLKPQEDKGYTYGLTEEAGEDFRSLLNVIYRVYFNTEQQPEFYVIVMADITNGVELSYIIFNEDLKKFYNTVLPGEEQYKRILQDIRGELTIINDEEGRHLTYQGINLAQFLAEQIVQRIRIKFFGADSGLCRTPEEDISKIISYVMYTYQFQDYLKVNLKNLSSGTETGMSRWDLEEIKEF
ncbi:MAG: hypothetical protein ABIH40_02565 [Candidatus Omnitrophota bacterium]